MKNITKAFKQMSSYWGMVFKEAFQYVWGEIRTLLFGIVVAFIVLWIGILGFFWEVIPSSWVDQTLDQAFLNLVTGGVAILILLVFVTIMVVFYLPPQIHERQQTALKIFEDEKHIARAEKLSLREVNKSNWVGIEVKNNENKKFHCFPQIVDIVGLESLNKPLDLTERGESLADPTIFSNTWNTYVIAEWNGGETARIVAIRDNYIEISSGRYTIITQLNGHFGGIDSGIIHILPTQKNWSLLFSSEEHRLELSLIDDKILDNSMS